MSDLFRYNYIDYHMFIYTINKINVIFVINLFKFTNLN